MVISVKATGNLKIDPDRYHMGDFFSEDAVGKALSPIIHEAIKEAGNDILKWALDEEDFYFQVSEDANRIEVIWGIDDQDSGENTIKISLDIMEFVDEYLDGIVSPKTGKISCSFGDVKYAEHAKKFASVLREASDKIMSRI